MTPALAAALGGALMMLAGIVAMATMSHCPRRWRVWPALLVASGALYASDRVLYVTGSGGYLEDIRAWVIVAAMLAVLGTVRVMAWMIQEMCPLCQRIGPPSLRVRVLDEHERGLSL